MLTLIKQSCDIYKIEVEYAQLHIFFHRINFVYVSTIPSFSNSR